MDIFFILPVTEILIVVYCFGSGLFVKNLIFIKDNQFKNYSEICIYGFLLTLIIAQIINFITPIKEIYFWFFLLIAILNIYKNKILIVNFYNWLFKLSLILLILTPLKFVIKGHDDIFYHLPKLNFINSEKIIFGIGNYYESFAFTNGWSHVSGFFNFFNGSEKNIYLVSYVFFILTINTLYNYYKKADDYNIKFFSLASIIFLCLKFYRLQEFGNDFQSILLIFLVFNLYYDYLNKNDHDDILIKKILLYSTFATLFKIHGVLINLLLIIFIFEINIFFKKNYLKIYGFILIAYFCTFLTSFINSGCILYPFESTCFDSNKISWSSKENINNTYLEAYNKSYENRYVGDNTAEKMSIDEWLHNFNWASFHFTSKNFYKPFLKSILILLVIFFILLKFSNFKMQKPKKKNLAFIFISIIILIIWFIKIPLMRASGYGYLVGFFIFLFCSLINVNRFNNLKKLNFTLLLITLVPILFLNINRIYIEKNKYNTNSTYFFLETYGQNGKKSMFRKYNSFSQLDLNNNNSFKVRKKLNYSILENFKDF
ncbi:hypothetical protein N8724_04140 [Candidatus Pelagibacter sp.]|nr:hypothetical protein [Candidatus Pelagibacter sp.]